METTTFVIHFLLIIYVITFIQFWQILFRLFKQVLSHLIFLHFVLEICWLIAIKYLHLYLLRNSCVFAHLLLVFTVFCRHLFTEFLSIFDLEITLYLFPICFHLYVDFLFTLFLHLSFLNMIKQMLRLIVVILRFFTRWKPKLLRNIDMNIDSWLPPFWRWTLFDFSLFHFH